MAEKRKRPHENLDRPRKIASTIQTASPSTINLLFPLTAAEWAPILASTPGFVLPSDIILDAFRKARPNTTILPPGMEANTIISNEILLHSTAGSKVEYLGREDAETTCIPKKQYIGIYDPVTNDLQIQEAREVVIRSYVQPASTPETPIGKDKQTNSSLRVELGNTFGTKKSRKAIASTRDNAISPNKYSLPKGESEPMDSATVGLLQTMAETTIDMPSRQELQKHIDESKPRPSADLTASKLEDVYPISILIGHETMALINIKKWQDAVAAKEAVTTSSRYVSNRLQNIVVSHDTKKIKVLKYLLLLMEFYRSLKPGKGGAKKLPGREVLKKLLDGSEYITERVRRKFVVASFLDKWHVDYLITHMAALCLIIDNFEVDIYDLKEDLNLKLTEMSKYFAEIGCKVVAISDAEKSRRHMTKAEALAHRMARLKLPLEFPKQRVYRSSKR
ncbi:MAG: DNA-directed RNA polymerase I subunit rpa49 [Trizodia sp. TS-e1964]|nr:MAG: DNA-directed RNA polymerase I subunit rpa49 [Trizodia sp. TS-e1964]